MTWGSLNFRSSSMTFFGSAEIAQINVGLEHA
jgi:hypothetical protein